MINTLALTTVFGLPMVVYGGILTLLLLLTTATVAYLHSMGKSPIPFKWHPRLAILTIIVAIMHGIFGLSIFMGF